jgi:predicted O-linked N-acetylglucosamine transferase (SPINDLY family)
VAELAARIEGDAAAALPYHMLSASGSALLQRKAAEIWVRERCPTDSSLPQPPRWAPHERIRVGYFSPDFWQHPVSILAVELFELHDRSRFEITAFGFGPPGEGAMRSRLARAFDRFLEVQGRSDREIALLARELEIDIAVDLCGFTQHCRPGIFAQRAAPLQVNFLGYSGTMGAAYMDYLVADPTLIPEPSRPHYREQILYLPHSVLPHDSQQPIAEAGLTRRQAGLPESGFVFCCFNTVAKITPHTFAGWMRILAQVPGSVLWLSAANPAAQRNLRREAAALSIPAERLIFAARLNSLPAHLARYRLADLFLDTLPYNAHATASDALWAGLPVLTQVGEAYAGRVAASLLTAIDLTDLITSTQALYESLAIELASDPARLTDLRERLARNRLSTPLFDTRRYARYLEAGYTKIHGRQLAHLPAADVYVPGDLAKPPAAGARPS